MSEVEEAGLRRLKHDLDEADWPTPELLARYATDPNGLPETDKQVVERALAASRIVADELATLRGFDFARLDDDRRVAEVGAVARAGVDAARSSWLDRLRTIGLLRPPTLAAVAALIALATWIALSDRTGRPTSAPDSPPQLAEREAPPAPLVPAPPTSEPGRIAAVEPPPEPSSKPTPEPADERSPANGPEPDAVPMPAPEGEILLAMAMPDYRPAYGLEPRSGADWIVRGGESTSPEIVALVPDHVARACSASPILHWSLDRLPASGELFFTVVDADDEPIVLDRRIARPTHAGLQRLDLASLSIALPEGRTLRWSIALRDDDAAAPTAFDFGWLRVEKPDAAKAAELAARDDGQLAARHAELGCYSEALEAAFVARAKHPGDPAPVRAVAKLAEQAGFDPKLAGN